MTDAMSQLPPELRYQIRDLGVPPDVLFGIGGASICNSICCFGGMFIAAMLGAIGGAIYAAMRYGIEDELEGEVLDEVFLESENSP